MTELIQHVSSVSVYYFLRFLISSGYITDMFAVENNLVCVHLLWHCWLQETFPLAKFEYKGHTPLLAASVTMHFAWVCNLSNPNNQWRNIARVFKVVCLFDIPSTCIISYSASHDNWCTATLWNMIITVQCEGMGEVGSARYEPALLPHARA